MKRITISIVACLTLTQCKGPSAPAPEQLARIVQDTPVVKDSIPVRLQWLNELDKMARPVMTSLAKERLHLEMPIVLADPDHLPEERKKAAYLEAFGRLLAGMAPWLNGEGGSAHEVALREEYRGLAIKAISHSVDPASPDYMEWEHGDQRLVDASFFALAFLHAPWLWEHSDSVTRANVVTALKRTRQVQPVFNNWILNSALIEIFFLHIGQEWDPMRVDLTLREFDQWYVGDGFYTDGPRFHLDYYNSLVIHPFLNRIIDEMRAREEQQAQASTVLLLKKTIKREKFRFEKMQEDMRARNDRYAVILERLIQPDGSYPVIGRSVIYRAGSFHLLADLAWRRALPGALSPAQVRTALTAVIHRTLSPVGTYDDKGWLNIGVSGHQPHLADVYITSGSVYMCANVFLPLGLPESDPFWASPAERTSSQKIWGGEDGPYDQHPDE